MYCVECRIVGIFAKFLKNKRKDFIPKNQGKKEEFVWVKRANGFLRFYAPASLSLRGLRAVVRKTRRVADKRKR